MPVCSTRQLLLATGRDRKINGSPIYDRVSDLSGLLTSNAKRTPLSTVIVYVKVSTTPLVGSRDVPWNWPRNGLGSIGNPFTFFCSSNKVLLRAGRKTEYVKYAASTGGKKDVPGLILINIFMPSCNSGIMDVKAVLKPALPATRKPLIKRISHGAPHRYSPPLVI